MMSQEFLDWLDAVRERAGVPFVLTSDGRPGDDGLHGLGCAVDIDSRRWNAVDKWKVAEAIFALSEVAPGKVEFEPVFNEDPHSDRHWHIAVDPRPGRQHEFVEADD